MLLPFPVTEHAQTLYFGVLKVLFSLKTCFYLVNVSTSGSWLRISVLSLEEDGCLVTLGTIQGAKHGN